MPYLVAYNKIDKGIATPPARNDDGHNGIATPPTAFGSQPPPSCFAIHLPQSTAFGEDHQEKEAHPLTGELSA